MQERPGRKSIRKRPGNRRTFLNASRTQPKRMPVFPMDEFPRDSEWLAGSNGDHLREQLRSHLRCGLPIARLGNGEALESGKGSGFNLGDPMGANQQRQAGEKERFHDGGEGYGENLFPLIRWNKIEAEQGEDFRWEFICRS